MKKTISILLLLLSLKFGINSMDIEDNKDINEEVGTSIKEDVRFYLEKFNIFVRKFNEEKKRREIRLNDSLKNLAFSNDRKRPLNREFSYYIDNRKEIDSDLAFVLKRIRKNVGELASFPKSKLDTITALFEDVRIGDLEQEIDLEIEDQD